jgi:hypothetical protein
MLPPPEQRAPTAVNKAVLVRKRNFATGFAPRHDYTKQELREMLAQAVKNTG